MPALYSAPGLFAAGPLQLLAGRRAALATSRVPPQLGHLAAQPQPYRAPGCLRPALAAAAAAYVVRQWRARPCRRRRPWHLLERRSGAEQAARPQSIAASLAGWGYVLVGVAFAVSIVFTLRQHPLFPWKPQDAAWSFAWLLQTIWDYYATAICLCGVIVATEGPVVGLFWSLGILLLGSSFSCAYVAMRLFRRGTLALRTVAAA
mmetsp:Transcript_83388/g.236328  ORF Transcript_83388/g.236328 Transcript_83388/m.236328 type:complete len:205 (+) Transcript_83388:73-687(+)